MRTNRALVAVPAALLSVGMLAGCGDKTTSASSSTTSSTTTTASTGDSSASSSSTSCPTENSKSFAKTRFVSDLALTAGTFHRYIYKPYQAGSFTKGHIDKTDALKAAAVAAVDVKLLKNATENAKANPTLCSKVAQPLSDALTKLKDVKATSLLSGNVGALAGAESAIKSAMTGSKDAGTDVTENQDLSQAQKLAG